MAVRGHILEVKGRAASRAELKSGKVFVKTIERMTFEVKYWMIRRHGVQHCV